MLLSHDWKSNKVVVAMVIITDLNLKKFIRLQNLGAKIVKMWKIVYLCENYNKKCIFKII